MAGVARINHGYSYKPRTNSEVTGRSMIESVRRSLVPGRSYLISDVGEKGCKQSVLMKLEGLYGSYALFRTDRGIPYTFDYLELDKRLIRREPADPDVLPSLV